MQTGNAEVDGYNVVAGMGATMVLNAAVYALSKRILSACTQDCPAYVEYFAQSPYYFGFSNLLDFSTAKWNPHADPHSPWTIEIFALVQSLLRGNSDKNTYYILAEPDVKKTATPLCTYVAG